MIGSSEFAAPTIEGAVTPSSTESPGLPGVIGAGFFGQPIWYQYISYHISNGMYDVPCRGRILDKQQLPHTRTFNVPCKAAIRRKRFIFT